MSRMGAIIEAKGQETLSSDDEDAVGRAGGGPAPIMSQMLEAQAKLNTDVFGKTAQQAQNAMFGVEEEDESSSEKEQSSSELAKKLMDIFSLPEMEEVVSEYPCWLLKSVLLQGYMYITTRHICFYAYLPRKTVNYSPLFGHVFALLICCRMLYRNLGICRNEGSRTSSTLGIGSY
jgi:sterol 3beta-glucosyltransferase